MSSIFTLLDSWTTSKPDQLLYCFLDISGTPVEQYTYQEFDTATNKFAAGLHHHYKFEKNDRILLAYPPGLEMICAFFACAKLGLIPVPVYPPTMQGFESAIYKIAYIAKDCEAKAVLTSKKYYWSVQLNINRKNTAGNVLYDYVSNLQWINSDDLKNAGENHFAKACSDILFLQYTSGSTSNPKGVKVSQQNVLHNNEMIYDHDLPIGVSWLPQYHDMGLIGYYLFFAMHGGSTYGFAPPDFIQRPALWLETIAKYKGTASSAPNFAYDYCTRPGRLSQQVLDKTDLSSLKFLMTAAEPVKPAVYRRFTEFFKPYGLTAHNYFAAYGLAENTLVVSNYGRRYLSIDTRSLKLNKEIKIVDDDDALTSTKIMSCGKPLGDIKVRIVDPEKLCALKDGEIGEIWVTGKSKCQGYWNKPELSKAIFEASIINENGTDNKYLRTGDMGFLQEGELYFCGRLKDMIIIRGLNYFPQDIEEVVEDVSEDVRKGFVAAFGIEVDFEEKLIIAVGVKNQNALPDAMTIMQEVKSKINIQPHIIAFVPAKSIPKTSSGKIIRHKTKQLWLDGELTIVSQFKATCDSGNLPNNTDSSFEEIKRKYGLKGYESYTLIDTLDSLDLAILIHDIQELLKKAGADSLAEKIDIRLIQEIKVSELFALAEQFEHASVEAVDRLNEMLSALQEEHTKMEKRRMFNDARLHFAPVLHHANDKAQGILLTGGTGFFGPFLLKSLMEQTDQQIYVLVRADSVFEARGRLLAGLETIAPVTSHLLDSFNQKVTPVLSDMAKPQLGLDKATWDFLAVHIHSIYHNAAMVNYLFNYDKMRDMNVMGMNEIIRLAFETHPKIFNQVSTTFIFGWATKSVLYETDSNAGMDLLDFGYSQTKWVGEQMVLNAIKLGLNARIFRPALITPSIEGGGNNFDISIRLLSFMINHGIAVDASNQVSFTPADIAANNIIAIAQQPQTVNRAFHVTRDHYANMKDVCNIISSLTGRKFTTYNLKDFVPEVVKRCRKDDLLFPLLDFLVRSVNNISSMEFKRYDSTHYQEARDISVFGKPDPSLEDTVKGILIFLDTKGILNYKIKQVFSPTAKGL